MNVSLWTLRTLKKDTKLRNAARMFFILKQKTSGRFAFSEISALTEDFSEYQIKEYISLLIHHGWIGQDRAGYCYLRGAKFFKFKYGNRLKQREQVVKIPDYALFGKESWRNFISGALVGFAAMGLKRKLKKQRKDDGASLKGGVDSTVPLSLSILETTFQVSKSEASRMRQNGSQSGLITNKENLLPLGIFCGYEEMGALREAQEAHTNIPGKCFRLVGGELNIQLANLVEANEFFFKTIRVK